MFRYCTNIGADITNIGSDIGENDRISCLGDTISENTISGHPLISGRVLSLYRGRYRDIISRLVLNFLFRQVFLQEDQHHDPDDDDDDDLNGDLDDKASCSPRLIGRL